jgi:AAA domain
MTVHQTELEPIPFTLEGLEQAFEIPRLNGSEPPPVDSFDAYGGIGDAVTIIEPPQTTGTPATLTLEEWLNRDLPPADPILGHWLTTTSRVLLNAPTGLGKTLLGIGLGLGVAAGTGFLHWRGIRPARVMFIDGEMSRRLLRARLADEASRLGLCPARMHALSHEDVENFGPLNTPQGQAFINGEIARIGGVDLILFDNVMSLIAGDMKDEEGWRQTLPLVKSLTQRKIGQLWVNHTGHDETRGYGTKTREWQMDTVGHLEEVNRPDTDVSFQLSFRKARERTPTNRADFADVRIALVNDRWISQTAAGGAAAKLPPLTRKFLDALREATVGNEANKIHGCPAASIVTWRAECVKRGLLEPTTKPDSARSLFSEKKRDLIAANWITCNDTMAWICS